MPRMIPATIVMRRARLSSPPARSTRKLVNRMARPVWRMIPITIPAEAVAIATGTVCSAPSRRAWIPFRRPTRVRTDPRQDDHRGGGDDGRVGGHEPLDQERQDD